MLCYIIDAGTTIVITIDWPAMRLVIFGPYFAGVHCNEKFCRIYGGHHLKQLHFTFLYNFISSLGPCIVTNALNDVPG